MRSACMMCEINIVRRAQANRSNLLVKQDNALICQLPTAALQYIHDPVFEYIEQSGIINN